jgi:hypothetical protein
LSYGRSDETEIYHEHDATGASRGAGCRPRAT